MSLNSGISKAISFSVLLIGIAIFYYYVIFLPKQEQAKLEFQKQQEQQRIDAQKQNQQAEASEAQFDARLEAQFNRTMLQECLDGAETNYTVTWKFECKMRGLKSDCSLPTDVANSINDNRKKAKDSCFKSYPQHPDGG